MLGWLLIAPRTAVLVLCLVARLTHRRRPSAAWGAAFAALGIRATTLLLWAALALPGPF